jgi:hypothetical protein
MTCFRFARLANGVPHRSYGFASEFRSPRNLATSLPVLFLWSSISPNHLPLLLRRVLPACHSAPVLRVLEAPSDPSRLSETAPHPVSVDRSTIGPGNVPFPEPASYTELRPSDRSPELSMRLRTPEVDPMVIPDGLGRPTSVSDGYPSYPCVLSHDRSAF